MTTTEKSLQALERAVLANELPSPLALTPAAPDYDGLLAARDADAFAAPWTRAYDDATAAYQRAGLPASVTSRVDHLRQHLYKRVFRETGVPDLAAYISDDVDLILKHLLTHTDNPWVNALWLAYQSGRIPSGALPDAPGQLADLLG